uniref:Putative trypsin-like serine protease n=1 Tax=Ixodes ricinus TaxID=34613 RepID=A0A6B0V6Y0_IXORI
MKFMTVAILVGTVVGLSRAQGVVQLENDLECGRPTISARIVNGTTAPIEKFPWMVKLRIKYRVWMGCCGVILTAKHVLTAAHCVKRNGTLEPSEIKISYGHAEHEKGQVLSVKALYRHRHFNATTYNHDIAMLVLSTSMTLGTTSKHICLPSGNHTLDNQKAIVVGWGSTHEKAKYETSELRYTTQTVWPSDKCRKKLKNFNQNTQICAYDRYSDACVGDSGGPLMIQKGEAFELIGLVSNGIGCNRPDMPGGYTRITRYLKWIHKAITHSNNRPEE